MTHLFNGATFCTNMGSLTLSIPLEKKNCIYLTVKITFLDRIRTPLLTLFLFLLLLPLLYYFTLAQLCRNSRPMGLLTFAKKVKPSKAAATKNQQPATISKRLDESISTPPVLPPIEQKVLDLAVGDKGLSLDVKSEVAENSLMADILGELSGQSTGGGKWQPKGMRPSLSVEIQ